MNNFKRIFALMLVLCMALCLCACGGGNETSGTTQSTQASSSSESDGKVEYKVTVLYPDGTPATGAQVQICLDDLCYIPVATDENGVAVFRLEEQEGYKTKLVSHLDGYVDADYIYFDEGSREITITLVAESDGKVDYKVTVLYPDGTPAAGLWVMICENDVCFNPVETDENGVAVFRLAEKEGYKAKVADILTDYVNADYIYFAEGSCEVTINLVAVE